MQKDHKTIEAPTQDEAKIHGSPVAAMRHYSIAGLTVASDMALPGVTESLHGTPDVELRSGPVPQHLAAPVISGPGWEFDGANFLLQLPGIGRIVARNGRCLAVEADTGADLQDLLVFALGTGIGALLYQRGVTVLHASAVADGPLALAFCGPSGIGKSTLAAALCNAGCRFVSDDVLAVRLDAANSPTVWPDARQLKLFEPGLSALGLSDRRQGAVRRKIKKFYVEPPGEPATEAVPLRAIYVLSSDEKLDDPQIEPIERLDAALVLQRNGYRPRLAAAMARVGNPIAVTAAILRHVPVYRLTRPTRLERLPHVAAALQRHWRSLGARAADAVSA